MLNVQLKTVEMRLELKLPTSFTTYFARHSFATIMREIGISKDDISLCLGHINQEQNLRTSGIYIKEDFLRMDVANRKLFDFIIKE
jgi:integrase